MKKTHDLIIDIGNSRVKFYPDDLLSFIEDDSSLKLFIVSTVQSKIDIVIDELAKKNKIDEIKIFDASEQTEIKGIYPELGNDRVAKLLGASILNPDKNIILMDFGTATTISVLDEMKNFKGGFIGLGMRSSLKALSEYCDALVDYSKDPELGDLIDNYDQKKIYENKSTKNAILLGAINSHIALIKQWIYRAKQMLGTDRKIITVCTGGEAAYFESFFDKHIEESVILSAACHFERSEKSSGAVR